MGPDTSTLWLNPWGDSGLAEPTRSYINAHNISYMLTKQSVECSMEGFFRRDTYVSDCLCESLVVDHWTPFGALPQGVLCHRGVVDAR